MFVTWDFILIPLESTAADSHFSGSREKWTSSKKSTMLFCFAAFPQKNCLMTPEQLSPAVCAQTLSTHSSCALHPFSVCWDCLLPKSGEETKLSVNLRDKLHRNIKIHSLSNHISGCYLPLLSLSSVFIQRDGLNPLEMQCS